MDQFYKIAPLSIDWHSTRVYVPGAVAGYLLLVRALRYQRRNGFLRRFAQKYGSSDREALKNMTVDDAWPVLRDMTELEFPSIFSAAVFFALFKTYGIPTISELLATTGQLASDATASKRATDTGVLVTEFVLNNPDSDRKLEGIARMNFLHDRYRKAGKISDADMLYTLSLFALEPCRWADRYDWRKPTDLERCALGVFWRDMGVSMGIPYDCLERYRSPHDDGLGWLEALNKWSTAYEEDFMVPADSNEKLAVSTLKIITFNTPVSWRPYVLNLVSTVLEPRLRMAMRIGEPGWSHKAIMSSFLTIRAWVVRYTHLPRPRWMRTRFFSDKPDPKTGRYYITQYVSHPWYVKPTFWSRWSWDALRTRMWGGLLPGDEGDKFHPEGYKIAEIGPEPMRGKGETEMAVIKAQLKERRMASAGCPMTPLKMG